MVQSSCLVVVERNVVIVRNDLRISSLEQHNEKIECNEIEFRVRADNVKGTWTPSENAYLQKDRNMGKYDHAIASLLGLIQGTLEPL